MTCVATRRGRNAALTARHKWDAGKALQLIQDERVTGFTGVPTMSWEMLNHPQLTKFDTSSLRRISGGGAPTAPRMVSEMATKLKTAAPAQVWDASAPARVMAVVFLSWDM